MSRHEGGFSVVETLLIVIVGVLLVGVGLTVRERIANKSKTPAAQQAVSWHTISSSCGSIQTPSTWARKPVNASYDAACSVPELNFEAKEPKLALSHEPSLERTLTGVYSELNISPWDYYAVNGYTATNQSILETRTVTDASSPVRLCGGEDVAEGSKSIPTCTVESVHPLSISGASHAQLAEVLTAYTKGNTSSRSFVVSDDPTLKVGATTFKKGIVLNGRVVLIVAHLEFTQVAKKCNPDEKYCAGPAYDDASRETVFSRQSLEAFERTTGFNDLTRALNSLILK